MSKYYDEGLNGIPFDAIDEYHEIINTEKNKNMCGLVGFSGKANTSVLKALHLLADNDSRGGHSTGMFVNGKIYKTLNESMNILPMLESNDTGGVLIGHTRYGTHGDNTVQNAHPFQHKNVIGAHNGVLNNYEEVGKKFGIDKTEVDSEMIIKVLAETKNMQNLGLFGGTKTVLYTIDGLLYVYRHNNPLFFLKNDDGVYFSSLKEGLQNIAKKNEKVKECKKDKLFVYKFGELVETVNIKHNPVPSTKVINTDWQSYGNRYQSYGFQGYNEDPLDAEWDTYNETKHIEAYDYDEIALNLQELLDRNHNFSIDDSMTIKRAIDVLEHWAEQIYFTT